MKGIGKYFIVGSARSGTTLLQAMVAAQPRVYSIPETHFFCESVPRSRRRRWLGLARAERASEALIGVTKLAGRPDLEHFVPAGSRFLRPYAKAFVEIMDAAALGKGKDCWVEKTPHHIDFIPSIASAVPGARFLHVIRDGRDVVASQQFAARQDSAYWGEWTVERLVELWNQDVTTSLSYLGRPRHEFVSYEVLIEDREPALRRVAPFLGLEFDEAMLHHERAAGRVVGWRKKHPWMQNTFRPVEDTRLKKFRQIFTEAVQDYIASHLVGGGQALGAAPAPVAAH